MTSLYIMKSFCNYCNSRMYLTKLSSLLWCKNCNQEKKRDETYSISLMCQKGHKIPFKDLNFYDVIYSVNRCKRCNGAVLTRKIQNVK